MEKNDLLKFLLSERDYHASHPAETGAKFWYALGATVTTIIAGLIFQEKVGILKCLIEDYLPVFITALVFIFGGYWFIILAINEHSKIHKFQLERLENAIDYLLNVENKYDYSSFWKEFGRIKFSINNDTDSYVKLFTKEPDTRTGWRFHDRKFEMGYLLIIIGVITLAAGLIVVANY